MEAVECDVVSGLSGSETASGKAGSVNGTTTSSSVNVTRFRELEEDVDEDTDDMKSGTAERPILWARIKLSERHRSKADTLYKLSHLGAGTKERPLVEVKMKEKRTKTRVTKWWFKSC